jgi:hypothetical protein
MDTAPVQLPQQPYTPIVSAPPAPQTPPPQKKSSSLKYLIIITVLLVIIIILAYLLLKSRLLREASSPSQGVVGDKIASLSENLSDPSVTNLALIYNLSDRISGIKNEEPTRLIWTVEPVNANGKTRQVQILLDGKSKLFALDKTGSSSALQTADITKVPKGAIVSIGVIDYLDPANLPLGSFIEWSRF